MRLLFKQTEQKIVLQEVFSSFYRTTIIQTQNEHPLTQLKYGSLTRNY